MSRTVTYTTGIVLLHLLVNIVHGSAHRELRIGLTPIASAFVILVVLLFPLIAMILVWTAKKQLGLILFSASMFPLCSAFIIISWPLALITSIPNPTLHGDSHLF